MAEFIKPYNDDPFVGNLSTPVNSSNFTKLFLGNLPAYRPGLSSLLRGLEIGMAHGYFLLGPFYILGPLRNSEVALLSGFLSVVGLILILTGGLSAGNTGALLVVSKLNLKMIENIDKPALSALWPNKKGMSVVLDLGANIECSSKNNKNN